MQYEPTHPPANQTILWIFCECTKACSALCGVRGVGSGQERGAKKRQTSVTQGLREGGRQGGSARERERAKEARDRDGESGSER